MDMLILSVFLIGAIVYVRYNKLKMNRKSEEMYRFYKTELEKMKCRVAEDELLTK